MVSNAMKRPASVRLMVALLGLLAVAAGPAPVAAGEAGTPTSACEATTATPWAVGADRVQLVLEARPPANVRITPEAICIARDVMAARLDGAGLAATVTVIADYRIVVEAAAGADLSALARLVTPVGLLEVIDPRGQTLPEGTLVATSLGGPETVLPPSAVVGEDVPGPAYTTIVSSDDVADAAVVFNQLNTPIVQFELTQDAADRFHRFTSANIGLPLSILVDKRVVSSAVIQEAISGTGTISGLEEDEVEALVAQLTAEALPVPFQVVTRDGSPASPDGTPAAESA